MAVDTTLIPADTGASGGVSNVAGLTARLFDYMVHVVGKDPRLAKPRDWYYALAYTVRGVVGERLMSSTRVRHKENVKRVYYLSMEFLIGRSMRKCLLDTGLLEIAQEALAKLDVDFREVLDCETDAALGNGGLGRLAACFMDSLATHCYPGYGYGIRYEFGMFTQRVVHGRQVEQPENWLRYGNPWEYERHSVTYPVRFNGRILREEGSDRCQWVDTDDVVAMGYDVPVSGYKSSSVAALRLWAARSTRDLDFRSFNEGNYIEAVRQKTLSENLTKVLYPNDSTEKGQELRLRQEYFFVSASMQDIIARFQRFNDSLDDLPEKTAVQLNDTHPTLAVPELMRILVDLYAYPWDRAWNITRKVFSYTNHTLLPEALETWPVHLMERVLPRHLDIIYKINDAWLKQVAEAYPGNVEALRRTSMIDDGSRRVRMAHVAIVGSHKVNGVAALHSQLLRTRTFPEFDHIFPGKFINVTNGITQRRWLMQANRSLSGFVTELIGDGWITDLSQIARLAEHAGDAQVRDRFAAVKLANKKRLAEMIRSRLGIALDPETLFDVQVKRIHEYKRQLLNLLQVIVRYNRIRHGARDMVPRTVIFAGKAAPGYEMAKLIIRLVNDVATRVNDDPAAEGLLKVAFVPDYNVTSAALIIPAGDLSEQISTAGTEASGTGNMKLALNGALTIGTLDGANIEIRQEVGEENFFIFGLDAQGVEDLRRRGYDPRATMSANQALREAVEMIERGEFSRDEPDRYRFLVDSLVGRDQYLLFADFDSYVECQSRVDRAFRNPAEWYRKALLNVAGMGYFSSDRAIHTYASDIWGVKPVRA